MSIGVSTFSMPELLTGLGVNFLVPLKETGLALDMAPMIKAANLDLNRLDNMRLNIAVTGDGNPDVTIIPYYLDTAALYYNKDIFDRFGVSYPKDRMTWDQVIELAKKVTRTNNGVQYRGLEPDAVDRPAGQMKLLTVDPKTKKAAVLEVASEFEPDGVKIIRTVFQDMIKKQTDVNTALRTADEQINQKIAEKQAQ